MDKQAIHGETTSVVRVGVFSVKISVESAIFHNRLNSLNMVAIFNIYIGYPIIFEKQSPQLRLFSYKIFIYCMIMVLLVFYLNIITKWRPRKNCNTFLTDEINRVIYCYILQSYWAKLYAVFCKMVLILF